MTTSSANTSGVSNDISVVLCTHNGEQFLPEQLASLTAQSRQPGEIVISDDASTDSTRDLVRRFARDSPVPVRLVFNDPGLGFRDNFMQAVGVATLPWVAFCDQDDIWDARKLERCEPALSVPGVTQVVHTATLVDATGAEVGFYDQGITDDALREPLYYDVWKTFSGFSMVVRREMFDVVGLERRFPPHEEPGQAVLAHDRWAFFLAQTLGRSVEIAQPLVSYRLHGGNVFGTARRTVRGKLRQLRQPGVDVSASHRRLVREAEDMLTLVDTLPAGLEERFSSFDRNAAHAFYAAVLARTAARLEVYSGGRRHGIGQVVRGVRGDLYRTENGGAINLNSVMKDLLYLTTTRHR